jgi:hypothetical protein
MDKAKAYPLFIKNRPDVLSGILHSDPGIINYYENFMFMPATSLGESVGRSKPPRRDSSAPRDGVVSAEGHFHRVHA